MNLTSKKPYFFSEKISETTSNDTKTSLSEKIHYFDFKINSLANSIYELAGGMEEKKLYLRSPKKKQKNDKAKKNLVDIFNEKAKKKKILGPYTKATFQIDNHIKFLKDILNDDEATRLDFIKKKKKQEEVQKLLDNNYRKNMELKKNLQENQSPGSLSPNKERSSDHEEHELYLRYEEPEQILQKKRNSIFNFHKQFSGLAPEYSSLEKSGSKLNPDNPIFQRKNINKSLSVINNTIKIVNNNVLSLNSLNSTLDQLVPNLNIINKSATNNFEGNNINTCSNYIPLRSSVNNMTNLNFHRSLDKLKISENSNNQDNENNYYTVKECTPNIINMINTKSNFPTFNSNKNLVTLNSNKNLISFSNYNTNSMSLKNVSQNSSVSNMKSTFNSFNYINTTNGKEKNKELSSKLQNENDRYRDVSNHDSNLNFNLNTPRSPNYMEKLNPYNLDNDNPQNININNLSQGNNLNVSNPENFDSVNMKIPANSLSKQSRNRNFFNINLSNNITGNSGLTRNFNGSLYNSGFSSSKKKEIESRIIQACMTTSNKSIGLKNRIENYSPIKNKIKIKRKKVDNVFLKPELEQDIDNENDKFKKTKRFFIYPKSFLNPVYISDNDRNVLRESNYVDSLNEEKAFAARNLIFNKYKVFIDKEDIYDYEKDIQQERSHKDKVENFKKSKIRNNSFNIKKLIFNTNIINKGIQDKLDVIKSNKIIKNIAKMLNEKAFQNEKQ